MAKEQRRRVVLELAPSFYEEVQEIAQEEDMSLHQGIYAAIRSWVDGHGKA
jgi:hypothetical protein